MKCIDCGIDLSPSRTEFWLVCVPCFEKRAAKWIGAAK